MNYDLFADAILFPVCVFILVYGAIRTFNK